MPSITCASYSHSSLFAARGREKGHMTLATSGIGRRHGVLETGEVWETSTFRGQERLPVGRLWVWAPSQGIPALGTGPGASLPP